MARFLGIHRRPVEAIALNPRTMRLCSEWLKACTSDHPACKTTTTPFVPTRLIDLGDASCPDQLRLLSTNLGPLGTAHCTDSDLSELPFRGLATRYLAFSYCWGSLSSTFMPFKTTKDNVHQQRCAISLEAMPQSFWDLFAVARELGLRYMGIDSLCIV